MPRIEGVLIQVTLFRATAIFFRLGCTLCPRGLPWTKGWLNIIITSTISVLVRLVTVSRYFLFSYRRLP